MDSTLITIRTVKDENALNAMISILSKEGVYYEALPVDEENHGAKTFNLKTTPELVDAADYYLRHLK